MSPHFQTEVAKHFIDALAGLTALGTLAAILPPLAAAASFIWYGIRIYEYIKNKKTED